LCSWTREYAAESAKKLRNLKPVRLAVGHGKTIESPLAAMDQAAELAFGAMRENAKLSWLSMAMEFAMTAPVMFTGADDSWQPGGARSFLFGPPRAICALAVASDGLERHCVLR